MSVGRWVVAGVTGVVAVGLVVVVLVGDLEQGEKIASVVGVVVSVLLGGFTVVSARPAGAGRRVRAGRGPSWSTGASAGARSGGGRR
ncbi:hypothetical protein AB6O49_22065 [Streptomyces sp. SBR177]